MAYTIQDVYTNTTETVYADLAEFKAFFDANKDDFFAIADTLGIESWDGTTFLSNVNNIVSEDFDADAQQYTRVTDWETEELYNSYRAAIGQMDWDTDDLYNLKNQTLGLEKVTTVL